MGEGVGVGGRRRMMAGLFSLDTCGEEATAQWASINDRTENVLLFSESLKEIIIRNKERREEE